MNKTEKRNKIIEVIAVGGLFMLGLIIGALSALHTNPFIIRFEMDDNTREALDVINSRQSSDAQGRNQTIIGSGAGLANVSEDNVILIYCDDVREGYHGAFDERDGSPYVVLLQYYRNAGETCAQYEDMMQWAEGIE